MPTTHKSTAPSPGAQPADNDAVAHMLTPEWAVEFWPRVEKLLDRAYEFADEIMPPTVIQDLFRRNRQLWIVSDGESVLAAVLTRIVQLRSCRAVQITACGGHASDRWAHLISKIEEFARYEGCSKIQIEGRLG